MDKHLESNSDREIKKWFFPYRDGDNVYPRVSLSLETAHYQVPGKNQNIEIIKYLRDFSFVNALICAEKSYFEFQLLAQSFCLSIFETFRVSLTAGWCHGAWCSGPGCGVSSCPAPHCWAGATTPGNTATTSGQSAVSGAEHYQHTKYQDSP